MKLKKENPNASQTPEAMDEALFEALNRQKKRRRRKRIRIVLILLVLLGIGGFAATRFLRRQVMTQFNNAAQTILSAPAQRGTISTLVSGSGMLANVDTQVVSVPAGVEITAVPVKYGDPVKAGDILATVDMASVRTALTELQKQIETLDQEIASAKGDQVSSSISAKVGGRVKAVYASPGDLVEDVMVDHGSLALLSLDGFLAADLENSSILPGSSLTALRSDGSELAAEVESVVGSRAVVLVSDDGPALGEEVSFRAADGSDLGSAELYIHTPFAITGYAGTVSYVSIQENQMVYSWSSLFSLTDTATTVNYDALLRTRDEYRDTMVELLQLQRNGALLSPIDGSIYSAIDPETADSTTATDVVTLSPDRQMEISITVKEADILSLEVGQQANITVRSIGDQVLQGTVTEIDRTYSSGSYTALVTLDKIPAMIPGMTAGVDVRIAGVDNAILIPSDALHQTSSGCYVYTGYDEETREYTGRVDVVPGLSSGSQVEIRSGLQEGDTVYYTKAQTWNWNNNRNSGRNNNSGSNSSAQRPSGSSGSSGAQWNGGNTGGQRPSGSSQRSGG